MKNHEKHNSLFKRIFVPLAILMVIQAVVYYVITAYGGAINTLKANAENVLTERVETQKNEVESLFNTKWTSFTTPIKNIGDVYSEMIQGGKTNLSYSPENQKKFLSDNAEALINMLRANEVCGAFLILNDSIEYEPREIGMEQRKYGLCIRDYTPTAEYSGNEDLSVIRCPSSITSNIGCTLESQWDAMYTFNDSQVGDYFYKPLEQAYNHKGADYDDLAYFDGTHSMGQNDRKVVSYSIPLIDGNGYPYAVLGIEITLDYLKTLISNTEYYSNNSSCNIIVQYQEGTTDYKIITYNGTVFQQCFGADSTFSATNVSNKSNLISCKGKNGALKMIGSVGDMNIYNHNTPFERQRLAVIGLVKESSLYSISSDIMRLLIVASVIVMIIGSILAFIISRQITRPINKLSSKVSTMEGNEKPQLEHVNIDEIDNLVTSIEELSEKVNRNEVRTEFFSRMSHDMRTPMNAIIGFSAPEIYESADDSTMREYMKKIHTSGGYLLSLINDVLDMTKIESQRMEMRKEAITTKRLADDIVPMIKELSNARRVNFELECKENFSFCADRQRLEQVLMNLLSNAVKFTPEDGTVKLKINKMLSDEPGKVTMKIVVQDNGIGMSEEFQKKMYQPFSQDATSEGGTGLGLSITKQIVGLMGGSIVCDSYPGVGTKFTLLMSYDMADEASDETAAEKDMTTDTENTKRNIDDNGSNMEGRRVLVCEDHPLNMQIAEVLLKRKGIIVDEAFDGTDGVEKFASSVPGTYDLILMDIRMPKMNGLESAEAIRKLDREDAHTVPIIAMTANAFTEDVEASKKAGMNEHLSKPIDPTILYLTLEKYIGSKA